VFLRRPCRSFAVAVAVAAACVVTSSAAAAPVMCTAALGRQFANLNPQGVVATHLFAKVDGRWIEPANLCVSATVAETPDRGIITRTLNVFVNNTIDGGFPNNHLPVGTLISLGIRLPRGMLIQTTSGRWRHGVVVSAGQETVFQARTVRWDYHQEAYFGSGLDCNLPPAVFASTFSAWINLNALRADRTPILDDRQYAGGFYENNAALAGPPMFMVDAAGDPTGVLIGVWGCGDHDPTTNEGYFDGFTPISVLRAFGLNADIAADVQLLSQLLEIHDNVTDTSVSATFTPVRADELQLESIPGVSLPATPHDSRLIGVRMTSVFSYSHHVLVQRAQPRAIQELSACRARGRTPVARGTSIVCPPTVRLSLPRPFRTGRALSISCDDACTILARLTIGKTPLATGRGRTRHAGTTRVRLRLNAAGRRLLATRASLPATLRVAVTDSAGNTAHLKRRLRLER
jgi:hypothetical protein